MEQIQVVQEAFNEERLDYEKQITSLREEVRYLQQKLDAADSGAEIEALQKQRDEMMAERDEVQLGKNKVKIITLYPVTVDDGGVTVTVSSTIYASRTSSIAHSFS